MHTLFLSCVYAFVRIAEGHSYLSTLAVTPILNHAIRAVLMRFIVGSVHCTSDLCKVTSGSLRGAVQSTCLCDHPPFSLHPTSV